MRIHFKLKPLALPFKMAFKQASFSRNVGESIWCEATRNKITGYGEGCPRCYVTQETLKGGMAWLKKQCASIQEQVNSEVDLKNWITQNRSLIDKHPAAFCAIETALLDLFAKEQNQSVETLLNLDSPQKGYNYTAVLGDSTIAKFEALLQRYLTMGCSDFKVKLSGDLMADQLKLSTIHTYCLAQEIVDYRVRLDANNLWGGQSENKVIDYLNQLPKPIFAIEEPIAPKQFKSLAKISRATNLPIILDESLCCLSDLTQLCKHKGKFIANLKVSRLGGLIRTIELIQLLKQNNIPIIIGAHVGETSVLTRAGMAAANAVGINLVALEGGFGLLLLERDQVHPSLSFGINGHINLRQPYTTKVNQKPSIIPIENWNCGWGLAIKKQPQKQLL